MSAERIGSAVLHFDSANDGSVTNFNAKLTIGGNFKGNISGSLKIVWSDGSQSQQYAISMGLFAFVPSFFFFFLSFVCFTSL